MPKVSIVVPIYNVSKYLKQCLDSIVQQTLTDIEIICVNDGSTDDSLAILQEYAEQDHRIKVIDKPNSGYGHTMNIGLEKATGEYIGIVESDDFIEPDMFEKLYEIASCHNVDVIKSNFFEYYEQTNANVIKNLIPEYCFDRVVQPVAYPAIFRMMPSIWSALYRKAFLDKNAVRFVESAGASYQDTGFIFKVWAMTDRAYFIPNALLHYRSDNVNSSVKSVAKVFCVCDEFKEIERYLKAKNKYDLLKHIFAWVKYHTYMWNWKRLKNPAKNEFYAVFASQLKTHFVNQELQPDLFGKKHFKRAVQICRHPKRFSRLYRLQHFPNTVANKIKYFKRKLK